MSINLLKKGKIFSQTLLPTLLVSMFNTDSKTNYQPLNHYIHFYGNDAHDKKTKRNNTGMVLKKIERKEIPPCVDVELENPSTETPWQTDPEKS